jgi:hypothetical protein
MEEPDPDQVAHGPLDRVAPGEVLRAVVDLAGQLFDGYLDRVYRQQVNEDRGLDFIVFSRGGASVISVIHGYIRLRLAELFPRAYTGGLALPAIPRMCLAQSSSTRDR